MKESMNTFIIDVSYIAFAKRKKRGLLMFDEKLCGMI